MVTISNLHVPGIWYVIEDCPKSLNGVYGIDFLQVIFVFLGGCTRDGSVNLAIIYGISGVFVIEIDLVLTSLRDISLFKIQ